MGKGLGAWRWAMTKDVREWSRVAIKRAATSSSRLQELSDNKKEADSGRHA